MSYIEHENLQEDPTAMGGETSWESPEFFPSAPAAEGGMPETENQDIPPGGDESAGDGMDAGAVQGDEQPPGETGGVPSGDDAGARSAADGAPTEEKAKRKRVTRKKAAEPPPEDDLEKQSPAAEEQTCADLSPEGESTLQTAEGGSNGEYPTAPEEPDTETAAFVLEESIEDEMEEDLGADSAAVDSDEDDTTSDQAEQPSAGSAARPRRVRRPSAAAKEQKRVFGGRPLDNKPSLMSLDLNKLDQELSAEEREEWNAIYASYRSKSILTGRIVGIDTHSFTVRNRETGERERRKMLCAVIIGYRVKVLIPETEVWVPGQERPSHVLRNMTGAEIDYTILDVDREGSVAIGSRRMAAVAQQHFFDTVKGGRKIGEKLTCRVLAVGPKRCLVECGGRDIGLSQKDLTYTSTPDLRERYHPGQTLDCILKEYDRGEGTIWISVKDTTANPFFGAIKRHPVNSRRQATISGKYAGGVFCTLPDETVCLCLYSTRHSDADFKIGDTVILVILRHDHDRSLIYGRILSRW